MFNKPSVLVQRGFGRLVEMIHAQETHEAQVFSLQDRPFLALSSGNLSFSVLDHLDLLPGPRWPLSGTGKTVTSATIVFHLTRQNQGQAGSGWQQACWKVTKG